MELIKPRRPRQRKVFWDPATPGLPADPATPGARIARPVNPALSQVYYYPNRPKLMPADPKNVFKPGREYIDQLEASGKYVAELKMNGDNTLIYTDTGRWMNRHKELLKFLPNAELLAEVERLFPAGSIINAETMDRHTKGIKNKLIVHCVMAWKGSLLLGKTWGDSRKILEGIDFSGCTCVSLSETHKDHFWDLFQQAWVADASVEGIILKDPKGKLIFSTRPVADVSWMLKIRKPCKKYAV